MKTTYPSGYVPADFSSWMNYIRKELHVHQLCQLDESINDLSSRRSMICSFGQSSVLNLRVVWVDNYSQQKFNCHV